MRILLAALGGFALDLILGDPASLAPFHPVVWMGRAVTALEKRLRACFPQSPGGEYAAGLTMVAILTAGVLLLSAGILRLLRTFFPPMAFSRSVYPAFSRASMV